MLWALGMAPAWIDDSDIGGPSRMAPLDLPF